MKQVWKVVGFLISYALFTTILYFILSFLHKIPASWSIFHVAGITLLITLAGYGLERWYAC